MTSVTIAGRWKWTIDRKCSFQHGAGRQGLDDCGNRPAPKPPANSGDRVPGLTLLTGTLVMPIPPEAEPEPIVVGIVAVSVLPSITVTGLMLRIGGGGGPLPPRRAPREVSQW